MNEAELRANHLLNYRLYSLKRFPTLWKYMKASASELSNRINRPKYLILLDMLYCNLRYGAMDSREYVLFSFYNKSNKERREYFTKRNYFRLIRKFDKTEFINLIDKSNQYNAYSEFIHRKWILCDSSIEKSEILSFISDVGDVIFKPISSDCGNGIVKVSSDDIQTINEILKSNNVYIVEECLKNCKELDTLNPYSLNTIRVTYVITKSGDVNVFSVMLRTSGVNESIVDNWGAGGLLLNVDVNTGVVCSVGLDESHKEYDHHPITKVPFVGFKVPQFNDVMDFAKDIARKNPKVVYGGLDIAITDNGLELIEINFPPANIGYQVFGKGYLKEINSIY